MSKIKNLINDPKNNINVINLIKKIYSGDKTKYVELLHRLMNNSIFTNNTYEELTKFESFILDCITKYMIGEKNVQQFRRFVEFNENNQISNNDLSTYKTFQQITSEVTSIEKVIKKKEEQKKIYIIHEDNEWLMLRPLSYESSLKYGANTKWCTASEVNTSYYKEYTNDGILIYTINKKTNYKVATFHSIRGGKTTHNGYWNQKDIRVDSMETQLTEQLRKLIYDITLDNNSLTNNELSVQIEQKVVEPKNETLFQPKSKLKNLLKTAIDRENELELGLPTNPLEDDSFKKLLTGYGFGSSSTDDEHKLMIKGKYVLENKLSKSLSISESQMKIMKKMLNEVEDKIKLNEGYNKRKL